MKSPRKPYRSPFWRPEFGEPDAGMRRRVSEPDISATEQQSKSPSTGREMAVRPPSSRSTAYTDGDVAMFSRFMAFDDAKERKEPEYGSSHSRLLHKAGAGRSKSSSIAGGVDDRAYSKQDDEMFRSLQSGLAGKYSPPKTDTAITRHPLVSSYRGYSQSDLAAFEQLTRFGRSAKN